MSTPLKSEHNIANARSPSKVIIDMHSSSPTPASSQSGPVLVASNSAASSSPLLKAQRASAAEEEGLKPPSFEIESGNAPGGSWSQRMIVSPFKRRVVAPAMAILKSGATPEGLAWSIAFGCTGGVFPVPATTTVICIAFALVFKLNVAAVQLINLLMTPINLATFMGFIRVGEWLFGAPPVALSLEPFKVDPLKALGEFWLSLCYGIVAWGIFTPVATFLLAELLKPFLRKAMAGMTQSRKTAAD
jgi:uncharacterized protein (DUF2062 family)